VGPGPPAPPAAHAPPHPKGGRPFADDRACFEGIVSLLRNGLRWRQMPACYPSGVTYWRWPKAWTEAGV
jgi:transposase